ncbi:MAG: aconitase X catalytic domain-containing protein [Deltaproteobacteria bacterium]|jgi:predicted aconitase|nr:aconitase X catalytic domain-containing protein [Deltaproteobacteria bacterium]
MRLSDEEKRMLDGKNGPLVQKAMANTVEYGRLVEAERLCQVTMAHLFCGAHPYLEAFASRDFDETFSEMAFISREKLVFDRLSPNCRCQSDVFPFSSNNWSEMTTDQDKVALNDIYLSRFSAMGVQLVGTCVPYLTGFIPLAGEHYVSSESHAVLLMNSLWGARGQADGIEAGFWAAVCGRTPLWGLHDPLQRKGTHHFLIEANLETVSDWDLFGHAAGLKIPPLAIPVFSGFSRPDIHMMKSAAASMATTSGAEMAHFVGLTPEAPTLEAALAPGAGRETVVIGPTELEQSRAMLSSGRDSELDYISLGCPHYTVYQLSEVAAKMAGRRVSNHTIVHVWTAAPFKEIADRMGYTKIIEATGAKLLTSTCPLVSGRRPVGAKVMAFDSAKQAHYMKSETGGEILYGSLDDCLKSAFSGRWEGAKG